MTTIGTDEAGAESAAVGRRRMSGEERRQQITRVVVDLVAQYGVQGTTTARIAAAAGVSEKALYKHFSSRDEMLRAGLDLVFDRADRLVRIREEASAFERLRAIARFHWNTVTASEDGFVYPLYEFVAAPPDSGMRERLRERQLAAVERIAQIIRDGQRSGEIRRHVDAEQVAWELMAVYTSEDVSYLMGVEEFATMGRSRAMLDRILRDIALDRSGHVPATEPRTGESLE